MEKIRSREIDGTTSAYGEVISNENSPYRNIMGALYSLQSRVEKEDIFELTRGNSIARIQVAQGAIMDHEIGGREDNAFVFREISLFLGEQFLLEIGLLRENQTFAWMKENTRMWKNYGRGEFFIKGEPIGWTSTDGNGGVGAIPLGNGLGIVVIEKNHEDNSSSFLSIYIKIDRDEN